MAKVTRARVFLVLLMVATMLVAKSVLADGEPTTKPSTNEFSELDIKIRGVMTRGEWSDASLQLIREFYDSYKPAHRRVDWGGKRTNLGKMGMSAAQTVAEYVGLYGRAAGAQGAIHPWLSVVRSPEGTFFVELERHRIPAVPWNGTILFTTGDVVFSDLPQLGEGKPHATLEMFAIFKTKDGWAFVSPAHPEYSKPLTRLDMAATQPAP
jgi:hypothetical protein